MISQPKGRQKATISLADFPVVFMSYDEPWADNVWQEVRKMRPNAKRVHGVKGLNACHVAAAEEAGTPWFLTVDADTTLHSDLSDVHFEEALLNPNFRLDWQSRNAVNGIVSGNGSLKLWSHELVLAMRSHEAAPKDRVSLDADIGTIRPGRSRLVLMPGCYSETNPARTPFHAFRAGFRETSFIGWMRERASLDGANDVEVLDQILTTWANLGQHAQNGMWMIYGARLGLWAAGTWETWDIRQTHNYNWFQQFWDSYVLPRIGPGGVFCPLTKLTWSSERLASECQSLGHSLSDRMSLAFADIEPEASWLMVEAQMSPALRALQSIDSLGRAFQTGRGAPVDIDMAEALYSDAALLNYPSAWTNLARLHQLKLVAQPDDALAERYLTCGMMLGCAHAPYHLAQLLKARDVADPARVGELIDLSAERGFAPVEETS